MPSAATKKNGKTGSVERDPTYVPRTPPEVNRAIKQRGRQRKELEKRTIVDVVADAINPRRRRP